MYSYIQRKGDVSPGRVSVALLLGVTTLKTSTLTVSTVLSVMLFRNFTGKFKCAVPVSCRWSIARQ